MNNKNKKELIPSDRTEFDETIDKYLKIIGDGVQNGMANSFLSVYYGIKEAIHYSKSDIGILFTSLIPSVLLREYNVIPLIYTPISYSLTALCIRGWKYIAEKWQFDKAMRECQVMTDNNKYPQLKTVKYEGMRKIYVVNSSIGVSKFQMRAQKLKSTSNICLYKVEQQGKNILLYTQKKSQIPEEYRELEKFGNVFKTLDLEVQVKEIENTEYYLNVYFNTSIYFNKLQTLLPEITHKLKVNKIDIKTYQGNYDYVMSYKKPLGIKTFLEAWDKSKDIIDKKVIPVMLGTNCETGEITVMDMAKDILHTLVAGESGGGKSIGLHNFCASFALANRKNVKCIFCDPKGNELKVYRRLPNITYVSNTGDILKALEGEVKEMDRRNKLFEPHDFITNLEEWNSTFPDKTLEYRVIVVDEIADYMEKGDKEIKDRFVSAVTRLSQLGRSTGFRLVLTTQNPVVTVIPGIISANLPSRIAYAVTTKRKSITVIDSNEAYFITEPGKFIFVNKKKKTLHKSFMVDMEEKKDVIKRLESYVSKKDENCLVSLEKSGIDEGVRGDEAHPDGMRIENTYNLYNFYITIQDMNGKLPVKKELEKLTGLTEWQLREYNKKLKLEGKLINKGNDIIVIENVDELAQRRGN